MVLDAFESESLDSGSFDPKEWASSLKREFGSSLDPTDGSYIRFTTAYRENLARWLYGGIDSTAANQAGFEMAAMDSATNMYSGVLREDGAKTLGLKEIHEYTINPDYYEQNLNQHAGYAAEVIGTTKENLISQREGSGLTTYRADDRPDLFKKNDQFIDKIRVNEAGEIVERVQVKFVGKSPSECLTKLASKKYDKYFESGNVDSIEIPKDFYDDVKKLIPERIESLERQLASANERGDAFTAQKLETRIERMGKIDQMIEKSTVTKNEALEATKHPLRYTAKLFAEDNFEMMHKASVEQAAFAASITAAVSTVDNVTKVFNGEITPQEAFVDVVVDTGIAGGLAYGTAFISTGVSQAMSSSSHKLISSLGHAYVPAIVISFGVQSFDSVVDFANGTITGSELAYDLTENAVSIGGSIGGSALAGTALGTVIPGAGNIVGFGVGLVGGVIGCAVASEAYVSAIKFGAENADVLADKAKRVASSTVELAAEVIPAKAGEIAIAFNDFAKVNNLPFRV